MQRHYRFEIISVNREGNSLPCSIEWDKSCYFTPSNLRMGEANTSRLKSNKRIMKEHLRAFRENGIYNNAFMISLRYPYKIWELVKNKLRIF